MMSNIYSHVASEDSNIMKKYCQFWQLTQRNQSIKKVLMDYFSIFGNCEKNQINSLLFFLDFELPSQLLVPTLLLYIFCTFFLSQDPRRIFFFFLLLFYLSFPLFYHVYLLFITQIQSYPCRLPPLHLHHLTLQFPQTTQCYRKQHVVATNNLAITLDDHEAIVK